MKTSRFNHPWCAGILGFRPRPIRVALPLPRRLADAIRSVWGFPARRRVALERRRVDFTDPDLRGAR